MEDFQRVLRQRNAAIRSGDPKAVVIWDKPFAETSRRLNERREHFILGLMKRVAEKYASWSNDHVPRFRFRPGWNTSQELVSQLKAGLDVDMRLGYTTRGPHRADLDILANGTIAEKAFSRGQQKIAVLAMNLALSAMISDTRGDPPILLVDDLTAELDRENRRRLLDEFDKGGGQVFLTKIEDSALQLDSSTARTFHVEHGAVK
jgi:DNA replication and repair protein RecF